MIANLIRLRPKKDPEQGDARERAERLFASGMNCAQAVLVASTGREDPEWMVVAKAFGGGIGDSKCVCGAVNGGVMALSLMGKGSRAGELMGTFREKNGAACCSALTRRFEWKSREHLDNCRRLTGETAAMVEELMK